MLEEADNRGAEISVRAPRPVSSYARFIALACFVLFSACVLQFGGFVPYTKRTPRDAVAGSWARGSVIRSRLTRQAPLVEYEALYSIPIVTPFKDLRWVSLEILLFGAL